MPRRPAIQEENYSEQLAHLRGFTAQFGILHDAQILQLKIWPRLAFDYAATRKVKTDTEHRTVEVLLTSTKKAPKNFKVLAEGFCKSVQWLLGPEWKVRILENKKVVFTADRTIAVPEAKYVGTDFAAGKVVPEKSWQFQKTVPSSPQKTTRR